MTTIRKQANQAYRDAITATFNAPNMTRPQIVRELREQGYKFLGRGCFAVAMAHPDQPDVVVKVGQRRSHRQYAKRFSDRFPEYVGFLKDSGTRSKYALKVYHFEEVSHVNGGTYVAVVERCFAGKGSEAQKSVSAAGQVVSRKSWGTNGASKTAASFIKRFAYLGTLDLHSGNVMLRRDGTPVITDPLA
ncbi:hypothetical protein HFN51_04435 [Rhizobium leguminosarum]|nr:hypothetical protein [Rhizobium leguminosarum]